MNLYFLVEGRRTEKKVYRAWIGYVFPQLTEAGKIEDVHSNHYFIMAGYGYPSYRQRIRESLRDIAGWGNIDHFFICVDCEEETPESKIREIKEIVSEGEHVSNCHVMVQNCCMETWFLGNRRIMKRNPVGEALREYKKFYDVSRDDPEDMGRPADYKFRAHFHEAYLKAMLRERGLRYSKSKPGIVMERPYFQELADRNIETGHMPTFGKLIRLWKKMGGDIPVRQQSA
ncbi:conserved hypothetical protein [Candidatus Desulfarcum epimagneticum]|uniref:RloB domain-containing protein n=1 Tax=uncultured Desulfobacteraceae bacterium TaxID=218296 RepID=A0A484HDZ7_9BACT|nr:conserved hypothetical protein [uncultured Desulfobacteraceae bacterium]